MKSIMSQNPCTTCTKDRQIGNPNLWETLCHNCDKKMKWEIEQYKRIKEIENILGDDYDLDLLQDMVAEVKNRKFTSGQEVWIVEREDGEAAEYSGYVCVAQIDMVVIVSPYIDGSGDIVDILSDQIEQTAEGRTGDLEVYPISDCYETREAAAAALKGEQNV